MRISELAAATNEPPRTLRFYEAEGLLSPVRRTPSGYRDYDSSAVGQVRSVRSLQHAGLSLGDIAALIHIRDTPGPISANDAALVAAALSRVDHQLDTLSRMRTHLETLDHRSATEHDATYGVRKDCPSSSPLKTEDD